MKIFNLILIFFTNALNIFLLSHLDYTDTDRCVGKEEEGGGGIGRGLDLDISRMWCYIVIPKRDHRRHTESMHAMVYFVLFEFRLFSHHGNDMMSSYNF